MAMRQLARLAGTVKRRRLRSRRGYHLRHFGVPIRQRILAASHRRLHSPRLAGSGHLWRSHCAAPTAQVRLSSGRTGGDAGGQSSALGPGDLRCGCQGRCGFRRTSQLRCSRQAGAGSAKNVGRTSDAAGAGGSGAPGDRRNSLSDSAPCGADGEQLRARRWSSLPMAALSSSPSRLAGASLLWLLAIDFVILTAERKT